MRPWTTPCALPTTASTALPARCSGPEAEANAVARRMRTGSIYVNYGQWDVKAPFGGYKQSGIGREGAVEGYEEFLEVKTIYDREGE